MKLQGNITQAERQKWFPWNNQLLYKFDGTVASKRNWMYAESKGWVPRSIWLSVRNNDRWQPVWCITKSYNVQYMTYIVQGANYLAGEECKGRRMLGVKSTSGEVWKEAKSARGEVCMGRRVQGAKGARDEECKGWRLLGHLSSGALIVRKPV